MVCCMNRSDVDNVLYEQRMIWVVCCMNEMLYFRDSKKYLGVYIMWYGQNADIRGRWMKNGHKGNRGCAMGSLAGNVEESQRG